MPDHIVDIAVGVVVNKIFQYRYPEELAGALEEGSRVLVPFGSRRVTGTVVGFPEKAERGGLKSVIEALGPPLAPGLVRLARWMSEYYLHPLGMTIETMVPAAVGRVGVKGRFAPPFTTETSPGTVQQLKQQKDDDYRGDQDKRVVVGRLVFLKFRKTYN